MPASSTPGRGLESRSRGAQIDAERFTAGKKGAQAARVRGGPIAGIKQPVQAVAVGELVGEHVQMDRQAQNNGGGYGKV